MMINYEDFNEYSLDAQVYSGYYTTNKNGAVIHLFGRNKNNERINFNITGFDPYYYEPYNKGEYTGLNGKKLRKVKVKYPHMVKKQRSKIAYEADIPFLRRFMIDSTFEMKNINPRIAYIDVETDPDGNLISMASAINDQEIIFDYGKDEILNRLNKLESFFEIDGFVGWNLPFDIGILESTYESYFKNKNRFIYFDLYKMFRSQWQGMQGVGLPNYTLDTVANHLFGNTKVDTEGKYPHELPLDLLEKYNCMDVELLRKIDNHMNLTNLYTTIAWVNHSLVEDTFGYSTIGDISLIREANRKGIILPSIQYRKEKDGYSGAWVFAKEGLYNDIHMFDVKSMYPTTILKYNISPEIKIGDKSKKGIMPELIERYIELRSKYEKGTAANSAIKIMANSLYGMNGFVGSRIYDIRKAEFITVKAREVIKGVKEHLERLKFNVVYGDTDSLAVVNCDPHKVSDYIKMYLEFNRLSEYIFEYEDHFEKGIILSKKQYAFKRKDGSYKLRGLALRRGDTSEYLKEIYEIVLEDLLADKTKDEILSRIREMFSQMKNEPLHKLTRNVSIGINKKYKSIPQHIRAYNYSKENLDYTLGYGEKIRILPIKKVPPNYPKTDVLALPAFDLPDGFEVDYKEIERQIITRLTQLLPDLEYISDLNQKSLDNWR